MAGKFGKFVLFTAVVGAVAAGAYYYFKKKEEGTQDVGDSSSDSHRSYVTLDSEKPFSEMSDTIKNNADTVEEFFDDEDTGSDADATETEEDTNAESIE